MTESTENALAAALAKASKDVSARPQFYKIFCDSEVFAILLSDVPEGQKSLSEGESIALQEVEYYGKIFIAVFSSLDALQAYVKHEVRYLGIKGADLLRIAKRELLLDPGAHFGKAFTRAEMDSMLGGSYSGLEAGAALTPKKKPALGVFSWLKKKA